MLSLVWLGFTRPIWCYLVILVVEQSWEKYDCSESLLCSPGGTHWRKTDRLVLTCWMGPVVEKISLQTLVQWLLQLVFQYLCKL